MTTLSRLSASLRRLFTQPTGELTRMQRSLRWLVELVRHCTRELLHDRAMEMAAALTYRTIFSLVPTFVLLLLVFNAFGGFKEHGVELQRSVYNGLGLSKLEMPDDARAAATRPAIDSTIMGSSPEERDIRASFDTLVSKLTSKTSDVSFGKIGIVGLAVLIWAALALVITVERSFNRIYGCSTGRAWHIRIPIYWAVITLGPVLLFVSIYLTGRLVDIVSRVSFVGPVLAWLSSFTALLASWLLLFLLYVLMPNTQVRVRPALIGSFVTAVFYELGKWGFGLYVSKAVPYAKLYGSLGLVPLFLFWIYLTWLIVLFGLELTYTLQAMKGRKFKHADTERENRAFTDPHWLLPVMATIGRAFNQGRAVTAGDLAFSLELPPQSITDMTQKLVNAGLINPVQRGEGDDAGFALALPPNQISVARLLDLSRTLSVGTHAQSPHAQATGWAYLDDLARQQQKAAGDATLATLLAETTPADKAPIPGEAGRL